MSNLIIFYSAIAATRPINTIRDIHPSPIAIVVNNNYLQASNDRRVHYCPEHLPETIRPSYTAGIKATS